MPCFGATGAVAHRGVKHRPGRESLLRVFAFPLLLPDRRGPRHSVGCHELVLETPLHNMTLALMDRRQVLGNSAALRARASARAQHDAVCVWLGEALRRGR